ncbi:hypothetical protein tpqmel_0839, partial [Candidatus Gastranaerophilus sp. (ex Termes propinquus)]
MGAGNVKGITVTQHTFTDMKPQSWQEFVLNGPQFEQKTIDTYGFDPSIFMGGVQNIPNAIDEPWTYFSNTDITTPGGVNPGNYDPNNNTTNPPVGGDPNVNGGNPIGGPINIVTDDNSNVTSAAVPGQDGNLINFDISNGGTLSIGTVNIYNSPGGHSTISAFDDDGNLVGKTTISPGPNNTVVANTYDSSNRVTSSEVKNQNGDTVSKSSYEYNSDGTLKKETMYDANGNVTGSKEFKYSKDADGNKITEYTTKDENGSAVSHTTQKYIKNAQGEYTGAYNEITTSASSSGGAAGKVLKEERFNPQGESTKVSEYAYNSDGTYSVKVTDNKTGAITKELRDKDGNIT